MVAALNLALVISAGFAAMSSATNVHVNIGCILINQTPVCQSKGNPLDVSGGSATFYARFDSNSKDTIIYSGCVLAATWPDYYGDIFFGADNCLYDATGNNINGQCCSGKPSSSPVTNPYAA